MSLNEILCGLGFHKWTSWYTDYTSGYRERRHCKRDGCKVKQRRSV